jgi:hypothetical protein
MNTGVSLPGTKLQWRETDHLPLPSVALPRIFPVQLFLICDEQWIFLELLVLCDHIARLRICNIYVELCPVDVTVVNSRGWIAETGNG